MDKLEQSYLTNLTEKAQQGSSNAFAELFAALYPRHAFYVGSMIPKEENLDTALRNIYVQIYHQLGTLRNPELFLPWSCRICYRYCMEYGEDSRDLAQSDRQVRTDVGIFPMGQLLRLPLTESQILLMRYAQGFSIRQIGDILNLETRQVKQYLLVAFRHLTNPSAESFLSPKDAGQAGKKSPGNRAPRTTQRTDQGASVDSAAGYQKIQKKILRQRKDPLAADRILKDIFETVAAKPNSVPLEALQAYAVYRKERFSLQKGITAAVLVLFLLLPILFILPEFEVDAVELGERGLPVYLVHVTTRLPVGKVLAAVNARSLPVYEADAFEYQIEPTRNGTLTIEVELFNRQRQIRQLEVTEVDAHGPQLIGNRVENDLVILQVQDEGIGVDYAEVYAVDAAGTIYRPLEVNPETGEITFPYPDEEWNVYIPDHIGNILHLAFTFES